MTPCVRLSLAMEWYLPSVDGLEPPWKDFRPLRPSEKLLWGSWCPEDVHQEVCYHLSYGVLLLINCGRGGVYAQEYADICLLKVGKFPNTLSGSFNGPFILSKSGVMGTVCRLIPTKLGSLLSRERGNFQGSLNFDFLGGPYNVPRRASIWEWSWIQDWPGVNMWILRWKRLKICCGSVGGPVVWCGAWDPGWFVGFTSPSSGLPSLCVLSVVAGLSVSQSQEETKLR